MSSPSGTELPMSTAIVLTRPDTLTLMVACSWGASEPLTATMRSMGLGSQGTVCTARGGAAPVDLGAWAGEHPANSPASATTPTPVPGRRGFMAAIIGKPAQEAMANRGQPHSPKEGLAEVGIGTRILYVCSVALSLSSIRWRRGPRR